MNTRWEAIDWRGELARLQHELQQSLGRAGARWQGESGQSGPVHPAAGSQTHGQQAASAATASRSAAAASSSATTPAINVWADEENLYVESELPGLEVSDVELFVTGRQLMFRGERKPPVVDKGVWHRQERPHGKFQRTLELPMDVDVNSVEAQFQNGVLLVKLPKHAEIRPRRIDIKIG
jgi:HSP20 family protein